LLPGEISAVRHVPSPVFLLLAVTGEKLAN
jgi:hypothetical protein